MDVNISSFQQRHSEKVTQYFINKMRPPLPVSDPSRRKAFVFTEYLKKGNFEAHSCGNGRFIQGAPSPDLEICFRLYKNKNSLSVHIHKDDLLQWLRTIPSLRKHFKYKYNPEPITAFISMDRLLPCYPEMSAKFDEDRREGRSFDVLELFVRHFLREGSVFATFGFEHLLKKRILTDLHLHDIQSQDRSMSEHLDLLDEAIGEVDERDIKGSSRPCFSMNEPLRAQLRAAIEGRDPIAVDKVLAMELAFVDTKTLCLAIRHYERDVFRLLLKHGAQVGVDDIIAEPLYRAAQAGLMDAVQLLLAYDANKEGGDSCISTTALNGAASGGHLEIVQYLVEKKGANINGNEYMSPLARAIKYRHAHIIDYLLGAGANVLGDKYLLLLLQSVRSKQGGLGLDEILERFRAGMDKDARDRLFSRAVSEGHFDIVRCLVEAGADVNPDTRHCKISEGSRLCDQEHSSPLAVAASKGYLKIVRCLIVAGANVNPDMCRRDNSTTKSFSCIQPHSSPLAAAASKGHLKVVRCLVAADANVNPDSPHCNATESLPCDQEHSSPLAIAASKGYLKIVRCLVVAGANVNPDTRHRNSSTTTNLRCRRPHYSPLGAAVESNRSEVAQFLSFHGATLVKGGGKGYILGDPYRSMSVGKSRKNCRSCKNGRPRNKGKSCDNIKHSEAVNVENCPVVAAIQTRERKAMACRLLAKVTDSRQKLFDASTIQGASAKFTAFVNRVGNSVFVWKSGTRAIRDICAGYMPRSLSDIVSALQVADAMRSVAPPSRLGCSKEEFINDIPRWASLVSLDDQSLFFEIASFLWGIPASTVAYEMADSLARPLMSLQDIVKHLVRTSGLSDHGPGNSHRLQTLRQQNLFDTHPILRCEKRPPLTEWDPLPKQAVQDSPHANTPKPPDPEWEELRNLARITVLVAGAIFGAILLYLCLYRYGFSTLCLPNLTSDTGQCWASSQIITRNNAILATYVGFTSPVEFGGWGSTEYLLPEQSSLSPVLPDSLPTEGVRDHMAAVQESYEGDYPMIDSSSVVDTIIDCSPSVSSQLTTSSPATTISSSSMITTTPDSTTTCTSMDGTISCEYCSSKFKLGKNGRRGQASNLQKHMKIHHPETIPDYHRVIYNCRYGCGTRDPNKSNIKAHENKHCANRKGRQPRCHGKWRQTIT